MKKQLTEEEKTDLEFLIKYEVAGRVLSGFMFLDWMNTIYSKWLVRKVMRKYRRFVEFTNENQC